MTKPDMTTCARCSCMMLRSEHDLCANCAMTDRPTDACTCGHSLDSHVLRTECGEQSCPCLRYDRPTDCPRCGSDDPAVRRLDWSNKFGGISCTDDWHDRPTDDAGRDVWVDDALPARTIVPYRPTDDLPASDPRRWADGTGRDRSDEIRLAVAHEREDALKASIRELKAERDDARGWAEHIRNQMDELAENEGLEVWNYTLPWEIVRPDYKWAGKQQS